MIKILRIFILIVVVIVLVFPNSGTAAPADDARIEELRRQIEALEKEAEELRGGIDSERAKAKTLQTEINALRSEISRIETQITLTAKKIEKTQIEIKDTGVVIFDTQRLIDRRRETIAELLVFLSQRDGESLLSTLIKNQNLSAFLSQAQQIDSVNTQLLGLVDELKGRKEELESSKRSLEGKTDELVELKQEHAARKISLLDVKSGRDSLLAQTKGQEAQYQKLLADVEERERQVNLEIFKLEDALRRSLDPNAFPSARHGILAWPVKGTKTQDYGCILTSFARRNYPDCNNGKGGFHNGLDIGAPFGTPLQAAEDGKVIATGNAPYAYGIWSTVEHPNGLVTAYTHMSSRAVSVGQEIKRGDVVGYMGSTGLSTGSHLHFMVYAPKTFSVKNSTVSGLLPIGATLNPIDYLP